MIDIKHYDTRFFVSRNDKLIIDMDLCVGGRSVAVHVFHVRGHMFGSSERNDQLHWLSPANIESVEIRVSHQRGPVMSLSI